MTGKDVSQIRFRLTDAFVDQYRDRDPQFGFNGLGALVYLRTYSRLKQDGTNEQWFETVRRVVEGTYSMQKRWVLQNQLPWNENRAHHSAKRMYERIFTFKFLPPGRGLWAMGSELTESRGLFAALNNCAFVSTANLAEDLHEPFTWLMDASMLGIGVGFDTLGAGALTLTGPSRDQIFEYQIPDTREGWVNSVQYVLDQYLAHRPRVTFDYSLIRSAGEPIRGFGGLAAGPEPLRKLHAQLNDLLGPKQGRKIDDGDIVDIQNMIGQCVVAGNVRRTAEIAFGSPTSDRFLDLKNPEVNPARMDWQTGWGYTSNNSVFAELGMDYSEVARRIAVNGEPGLAWLENMQAYSRMGQPADYKDQKARGGNPCLEQTLESYELCCLVETFPNRHESFEDYEETLKFAYLYAKTVTLGPTPWPKTNQVMLRNRRIGLSQSGIAQAVYKLGLEEYRQWCGAGYDVVQHWDRVYSDWLAIPRSIKTTSVKPSGSVSLLAGATAGMHWPEARFYVKRMRLSAYSDLVPALKRAGYPVEPSINDPENTVVVEIPVKIEEPVRTRAEVSMWEQLSLAAFLQRYWADNQVSCTVTFGSDEVTYIAPALEYFQYQLKGVSLLPLLEEGAYPQMPEQGITEEEYERRKAALRPLTFGTTHEKAEAERFCTNDTCTI